MRPPEKAVAEAAVAADDDTDAGSCRDWVDAMVANNLDLGLVGDWNSCCFRPNRMIWILRQEVHRNSDHCSPSKTPSGGAGAAGAPPFDLPALQPCDRHAPTHKCWGNTVRSGDFREADDNSVLVGR
jgi:hypothetical protein